MIFNYDENFLKQEGVCAICSNPQYGNEKLCADFCNITGNFRGLLCYSCKSCIDLLNNNSKNVVKYLISSTRSSWDEYFMNIAILTSSRSKDKSTKVGAVIVRDRVVLSTGYNGFPRGINDDLEERHERPEKYKWVCHAEENAILNAARLGVKVQNSELYVTLFPCSNCAKSIIQSQISRIIVLNDLNPRWTDEFKFSKLMLEETGIKIDYIST